MLSIAISKRRKIHWERKCRPTLQRPIWFLCTTVQTPVAGINGKYALQGSNPVGDSLESDFAELATQPQILVMAWSRWYGHQQVRILERLLGASTNLPLQSTTLAYGWLRRSPTSRMGRTIRFTTTIVREIIDVGSVTDTGLSSGTAQITYADAYDDDDLEVHLMFHEYIEPVVVEEEEQPEPETEDTPFVSMPLTILALLAVALRQKRQ